MSHPRTIVRDACYKQVKKLLNGIPLLLTRPDPLSDPQVPSVLMYCGEEDLDIVEGHILQPSRYERKLNLNVDIVCADSVDPDTELDRIALMVEDGFYLDPRFGVDTDVLQINGSRLARVIPLTFASMTGDRSYFCQRMQWIITYETDTQVAQRINEFLSFNVDYTSPEHDGALVMESDNIIRSK